MWHKHRHSTDASMIGSSSHSSRSDTHKYAKIRMHSCFSFRCMHRHSHCTLSLRSDSYYHDHSHTYYHSTIHYHCPSYGSYHSYTAPVAMITHTTNPVPVTMTARTSHTASVPTTLLVGYAHQDLTHRRTGLGFLSSTMFMSVYIYVVLVLSSSMFVSVCIYDGLD